MAFDDIEPWMQWPGMGVDDLSLDECDRYGLSRPGRDDDYCDWSFLRPSACAHCLGQVLDPDLEEAAKQ